MLAKGQIDPQFVIGPVLQGRVDEGIGQAGVRAEAIPHTPNLELRHASGAPLAFGLSGAKDQDGFPVLADDFADELVGWPDLQPFGAPAKFLPRREKKLAVRDKRGLSKGGCENRDEIVQRGSERVS